MGNVVPIIARRPAVDRTYALSGAAERGRCLSRQHKAVEPATLAARRGAIMATGCSNYPNQVDNVLCFPPVFRGDLGATTINEEMKAPAVARAEMESGVATRPIIDFAQYRHELQRFVFRSAQLMQPTFEAASQSLQRIVYGEGEDERVLRAVQTLVDDGIAEPILIGRRPVIEAKMRALGLRMDLEQTVRILDPAVDDAVFGPLVRPFQLVAGRRGMPPDAAEFRLHSQRTIAAAMLLQSGQVDAALVGGIGDWWRHMGNVMPIISRRPEVSRIYALSALVLQSGVIFFCDTHMNVDPTAEQVAEMTLLAAEAVRAFGIVPKAALLSHSSFGASHSPSARKIRTALGLIAKRAPELEIDGEMHADAALSEAIRNGAVADSRLEGTANLLICPSLDAANIAFNLLKAAADGLPIGPMLLGMCKPVHVLPQSVTARGIANLSAIAALAAQGGD